MNKKMEHDMETRLTQAVPEDLGKLTGARGGIREYKKMETTSGFTVLKDLG